MLEGLANEPTILRAEIYARVATDNAPLRDTYSEELQWLQRYHDALS